MRRVRERSPRGPRDASRLALVCAVAAGCLNVPPRPGVGGDAAVDADGGSTGTADARLEALGEHLLITEVMTTRVPSASEENAEFIEIYNPTASPVALSDHYLADTQNYATLPAGADKEFNSDFIARFPDGTTIAAREVIVIAIDGRSFEAAHGMTPDYSLREQGEERAMVDLDVGTDDTLLTNSGEMVALFAWDGASDLVSDVDLIITGIVDNSNDQNALIDKTGLALDGPDEDAETSTYADDARTVLELEAPSDDGLSVKRVALEAGHEDQDGGGNGVTGHDETSEDFLETLHHNRAEYTAPTPGEVPAALTEPPAQ